MRKYLTVLLAIAFSLCLSFVIMADDNGNAVLEDGIYNIKNTSSGEYLNAYDFSYNKNGYAYTDVKHDEEGENVLVLRQDDGSYLLYPQSEGGKYAFFSAKDDNAVMKSEEITERSYFTVSYEADGYTISDADGMYLSVGDEKLLNKTLVIKSGVKEGGSQKWEFSRVEVSSLELKMVTTSCVAKVNSVSAVYAVTKPAYMKQFIQWSSSDEAILMIDDDGTFCALSEGVATVTARLGNITQSIDVTVVDKDAFTWYSQHLAYDGGWHGGELSNVYFQSGSYRRFIINGFNRGLDWMDQGCFLTSIAMVMHNLGARYEGGYDFRFDADGALEIDPYTAALANSNNRGLTSSKGTLYNNPILISYGRLNSAYTLHGRPVKFTQSYGVSKAALKAALDLHPEGVIVCMKNSYNGTHYIVVTECINPDAASPSDYRFMIYDSAGLRASHGNNVPFELSISYDDMRYRYSHMRSMIVFNIVEE